MKRDPRTHARLGVVVALALTAAAPAAATGGTDTATTLRAALRVEFTPGLCAPGAAPFGCAITPEVVHWEATTLACAANGTFEGVSLPLDAPCVWQGSGRLVPIAPGVWTPDCLGGARVEVDDGSLQIDGTTRAAATGEQFRVRLDGHQVLRGWVDDADEDTVPAGDHEFTATLSSRRGSPAGPSEGMFCVTTPLRVVEFAANGLIG